MNLLSGNLWRIGMSHHPTMGWSGSVMVHVLGAVVASATFVTFVPTERPELAGRRAAAEIELLATWVQPPQPAPPVEIVPTEPQVVVEPDRVHVADRTFFQTGTDVSQPTPTEAAMVDRLMSIAPPVRRHEQTAGSPGESEPPVRRVSRRPDRVEVAAAPGKMARSAPRAVSIGTNDRRPPRLLSNRPPTYPAHAIARRVEGTVLLRIQISADGNVGHLEVLASSGHPILDAAAVRAVRSWRFAPAVNSGRAVAATVRLPVRFSLDNS